MNNALRNFFFALCRVLLGAALLFASGASWAQSSGNTIDLGDSSSTGGGGWNWNYDRGSHLFTITGSGVTVTGSTSSNRIVVASGGAQKVITLNGATIDMSQVGGESAFALDNANVLLLLQGRSANSLKGGTNAPGLQVQNGSTLTIDTTGDGTGSLDATGGAFGAGIGGGYSLGYFGSHGEGGGTITINGGNITAHGGFFGAGIGGGGAASYNGLFGGGGGMGGIITIGGNAHVTATGGDGGAAGIGGGYKGGDKNSSITISGSANVTAAGGGSGGAGIGSGANDGNELSAGSIRIDTTGTVIANAGGAGDGAGQGVNIGGGGWSKGRFGNGLQSAAPPSDATAPPGTSATFYPGAVSLQGAPGLAYIWETNIPVWTVVAVTATATPVSIFSYSPGQQVRYTVHVYGGSMASGSDIYYVFHPTLYTNTVTITTQPASTTVLHGDSVTLSCVATAATGTPTYQWYKDGQPITGATGTTYNVPTQTPGTSLYSCQAKADGAKPAGSQVATVTVLSDLHLSELKVHDITTTSANFDVTSNKDAEGYWAVLRAPDRKVTAEQVIQLGLMAAKVPVERRCRPTINPIPGSLSVAAGTGTVRPPAVFTGSVRCLRANTFYVLYFVARDRTGATSNMVSAWFKTLPPPPPTSCKPPILTGLTVDPATITRTSAQFSVTSDCTAMGYWKVQPADQQPPDMTSPGSGQMTANVLFTRQLTNLSPATSYRLHFVADTGLTNGSTGVESTPPFTTKP